VHSLATGVVLNSLFISPLVNVIQGSITRRLIASIYDDITNSSLGYQDYYVTGKEMRCVDRDLHTELTRSHRIPILVSGARVHGLTDFVYPLNAVAKTKEEARPIVPLAPYADVQEVGNRAS
jgi:hypothetical protein